MELDDIARMVAKAGISDTGEWIELLQRFIKLFVKCRISYLTAERKFRDQKWVKWIQLNKVSF